MVHVWWVYRLWYVYTWFQCLQCIIWPKACKWKNRLSLLLFSSHVFIYWILKKNFFLWLRSVIFHNCNKYENIILCTLHSIEMKHTVTVLSHTVAVIYRSTGRSHYFCRYKCWLTLSFASMSAPLSSSAVAVSVRPLRDAKWRAVLPS